MELNTDFMIQTFSLLAKGLPVTLGLTALSLFLSAGPAFWIALRRMQRKGAGARAAGLYVSFIRGTPMILQILLMYSLLPSALNIFVKSAGIPLNVFDQVNPFWYACVIFTLNTAALLSEVFRSAILSIPAGQMEAGLSVGLTRWQTYRKIILPQAMSVAVPSICNITVNLIKGTSLAFLMGVKDILAVAKIQASYGYNYIEAYLDVFLVYIILCTVIQLFFRYAEKMAGHYRTAQ